MMYNVLWIDDEHENMKGFKTLASIKGIALKPFKSAYSGISELQSDYHNYDAVLLDAKFLENEDDASGTEDLMNLGIVKDAILTLPKKLEYFIFTGQAENYQQDIFKAIAASYYKKGLEEETEKLLNALVTACEKQPDYQARKLNPQIFEIFDLGYLNSDTEQQVLHLIKTVNYDNPAELKGILANIRSIQEACFVKLQAIKVVPDTESSFNKIMWHLSGSKSKNSNWVVTTEEYQTSEIENLHKWIHYTCGTFIHHLESKHYDGYQISPYAVKSLKYGILEILMWFKLTCKKYQ